MNSLTLSVFRSRIMRTVSLVLVCLLLLGSGYAVWWAFSLPAEKEEQVTLVSYVHKGEFDYLVYPKRGAASTERSPIYFRRSIDNMTVDFNYAFVPEKGVTQVTEEVEISVLLRLPEVWEKELILVPRTAKTGNFTISVPLDLEQIETVAAAIANETGVDVFPDVTLKVSVHTVADTDSGVLEDDFVHTIGIELQATTLQWVGSLGVVQNGFYQGLRYEHWGDWSQCAGICRSRC